MRFGVAVIGGVCAGFAVLFLCKSLGVPEVASLAASALTCFGTIIFIERL